MKLNIFIVLFLFFLTGSAYSQDKRIAYFENDYMGLKPGYSTLEDIKNILGKLKEVEKTSNGHNYHFEEVIVNISGKDKEHINTISIVSDKSFFCPNGVILGDTIETTQKKLKKYKTGKRYLYDNTSGIFYWHDAQRITKIVLVYSAYK